MDAAGQHQNNLEKTVEKTRLDQAGINLGLFKGIPF